MKSFLEFICQEELDEGAHKTGLLLTYAARSRAEGHRAMKAYERGKSALRAEAEPSGTDGRLERIERALSGLLDGLSHSRLQIGNSVAVDVAGHTLAAKDIKRAFRNTRR